MYVGAEVSSKNYPLVSIVITSYNREKWIRQAIESALEQDYPNFEVIVSDNCSNDGTDLLIKSYLKDGRIKYYKNSSNIGMIANFHKTYSELANGKYFMHVSSDDYLINSSFVSKAVEAFEKFPSIEVVTGVSSILFEENGSYQLSDGYKYYKNSFFKNEFVDGKTCFLSFQKMHAISFAACMIKLSSLKELYIDKEITNSLDIQILLLLLLKGDAFFLDQNSYVFRVHKNQASLSFFTAEHLIKNNRFAEIPYEVAINSGYFQPDELEKWRYNILFPYINYGLNWLIRVDRKEHAKFYAYAKENFPDMVKKITASLKYRIKQFLPFFLIKA
jgi:glycosyltransferase involved in cell wall biosynthesis